MEENNQIMIDTKNIYVFELESGGDHEICFFEYRMKSLLKGRFEPVGHFPFCVDVDDYLGTKKFLKNKEDLWVDVGGYRFFYTGYTLKDAIDKKEISLSELIKEEERQTQLNRLRYANGYEGRDANDYNYGL